MHIRFSLHDCHNTIHCIVIKWYVCLKSKNDILLKMWPDIISKIHSQVKWLYYPLHFLYPSYLLYIINWRGDQKLIKFVFLFLILLVWNSIYFIPCLYLLESIFLKVAQKSIYMVKLHSFPKVCINACNLFITDLWGWVLFVCLFFAFILCCVFNKHCSLI